MLAQSLLPASGRELPETYAGRQYSALRDHAEPILGYLEHHPCLTDLAVNDDGRIWINESGGGGWRAVGTMRASRTAAILRDVAAIREITFNHEHPILETTFPIGGSRIEGLIPPVVANAALAIRTRSKKIYTLDDYEDAGILTELGDPLNRKRHQDDFTEQAPGKRHKEILRLAARYRRNIIVIGGTGSGKTTFLNGIIHAIHAIHQETPGDRLVIIEDTPELQCEVPNHLFLLATSRISQSECLTASLRLKPDRILVGEVRKTEPARTLLEAWNTGHSGGLATIHADDAKGGLYRLEELLQTSSARAQIARAVHLVVFIDSEDALPAGRKVRELLVVRGLAPNGDYNCYQV